MSKHRCDFCQKDIISNVNKVSAIISYLPCFHAICQKCKAGRFHTNDAISCIICNYEPFQSEIFDLELPDSNKIHCLFCANNLRERVEFCCHSCNFSFVCRNCVSKHEMAKHNVTRVQHELLPRSQCSLHQNIQAIALCSCKTRLCEICVPIHVKQTEHVWKPILAVAQTSRQNLAHLMNITQQDATSLQITLPFLYKNKILIKEMASKARNAVANEIVELCNALIRRGNDIVSAIDLAEETKLKTFIKFENEIKFAQDKLKKIEFFVDMALNTIPTDLPGIISANFFAESAYSLYNQKQKQMQLNIDTLLQNLSKIEYSSNLSLILTDIKKFGQIDIDGILSTPQTTTSHNARMFSVTNATTLIPNSTNSEVLNSVNITKTLQSKAHCFGLPLLNNALNNCNEISNLNSSFSMCNAALAAISKHQYEEKELKKKLELETNTLLMPLFGTNASGSKFSSNSSSIQNNGLITSTHFLPRNPFVHSAYFQQQLHYQQQHAKNMISMQKVKQQNSNTLLTSSANINPSLNFPASSCLNNSTFFKSIVLNSQQQQQNQAMAMAAIYSNQCLSNALQQKKEPNVLQNQLLSMNNENSINFDVKINDKVLNVSNQLLTDNSRKTVQSPALTTQIKNNLEIQPDTLNQQKTSDLKQTKTKDVDDVNNEIVRENFSLSSIESNENQENENLNTVIEKCIKIDKKINESKEESNNENFENFNENVEKRKRVLSEDLENEVVKNEKIAKKSRFSENLDEFTILYNLNKKKIVKENNEKENKLDLTSENNEISDKNLCQKSTDNNLCLDFFEEKFENKDSADLLTPTITSLSKHSVPKIVLKKKNDAYAADIVSTTISFNQKKKKINSTIPYKKNEVFDKTNNNKKLLIVNEDLNQKLDKDCTKINEFNSPIIQKSVTETHNIETTVSNNKISEPDQWDDYCFVCNQGCDDSTGLLGCCANCTHVFHNKCHIPAIKEEMSELPDDWKCSSCIPCSVLISPSNVFGEQEKLLCSKVILTCFKAKPDVEAFAHKVPKNVVSYYELIKNPISFDIIAERISSNFYENVKQFISDLNLLFQNCSLFNAPSTPVAKSGRIVYALFRDAIREYLPFYVNNVWIYVSLRNDDESTKFLKRNLLKRPKRESSITKIVFN